MSAAVTEPAAAKGVAGPGAVARRERLAALVQRAGAPIVLLVLVVVASAASPGFASWPNVSGVLGGNAFVWLLALGMTFVITTGGIDLSVGSMYALGGVLAADASRAGSWAALLVPVLAGAAWGGVQGLLVARARMAPFIVTLAGLLGLRGVLQAITSEGSRTYLVPPHAWARDLGAGTWVPVLVVTALFAAGALLLTRTRFGATLTAIGGNENAAVLMGLPVASAKVGVYMLSGTLAGLAGALGGLRLGSGVTTIGVGYELTAIAAVVIGGTLLTGGHGTVGGTVCGVLLLAVLHNLIDHYFSSYGSAFTDAVNGAFLAAVVLTQTLLGRARGAQ